MKPIKTSPLYFDYQSTTPCDPRVLEKMLPYFTENFGNPHSRSHAYGWAAEDAVEKARTQVAELINADPRAVIFTSGATESNNIALKGIARFYKKEKNHIITCATEHKCVLESCRNLEAEGFKITYLPVNEKGFISLEALQAALTPQSLLVSIMAVNNEIGVIQPLKEIGYICRKAGVFFHTDAAQGVGKIPIDVEAMQIDLLSLSGHKLYGPKGVGALYVRRKPRIRVHALMSGGGQERGMRPGTLSPPLCIGLGAACALAQEEMSTESLRLKTLQTYFYQEILKSLEDVYLNGDLEQRIPGNLNLSFAHVEGEGLIMGIKTLAVSSGSACTSASLEPSYVLRALGVSEELAHTSIRIGFGRFTTREDVEYALEKIIQQVKRLREMSPLWEMSQAGIDLQSIQWAAH